MKELTVKENSTLKKFTDNFYPQGSFYFDRLLKNKDIRVNGVKVNKDVSLRFGDVVTYYTTSAQEKKSAFKIIYKDENILICDKESGVNSEAVFNSLSEKYPETRFIHRLDRNTTGLISFAMNEEAEKEFLAAFKEKRVHKKYLSLCFGKFTKEHAVLSAYLKKDEKNSVVKIFDEEKKGEKILTEYSVIKTTGDFTLVEITLHTGKTHQIRAHMAHVGCPVAGDEKYGNRELNKAHNLKRQCLTAKYLSFDFNGKLSYLNGKIFESEKEFII